MEKEPLTPELKRLLEKVKLKEPPRTLTADYLAGVNARIDQRAKGVHFGFPQLTIFFVAGLALAGALYFFLKPMPNPQPQNPHVIASALPAGRQEAPVDQAAVGRLVIWHRSVGSAKQSQNSEIASALPETLPRNDGIAQKPLKTLSVEEEMAILEAFSEESGNQVGDLFGDNESLEELSVLDELELSPSKSVQSAGA